MRGGVDEGACLDDDRRLTVRGANLDDTRDVGEEPGAQEATLRSSYAGGTPAFTASWSRTIPSIS